MDSVRLQTHTEWYDDDAAFLMAAIREMEKSHWSVRQILEISMTRYIVVYERDV